MYSFRQRAIAEEESDRRERRRVSRAAAALVATIALGAYGFMAIEGWPAWDAIYFTLITITTVGYGDHGLSPDGRKFAAFVLVFGLASSSYAFAVIVQSLGQHDLGRRKRMRNRIDALNEHTVICGFGRMGRTIADELHRHGRPFVILEESIELCEEASAAGYLAILGSAAEDGAMIQAGVSRASTIVAAVGSTATSIVIAITARDMSPNAQIIARAERDEDERKLRRAGATRIISPYTIGGHEVATAIVRPAIADFLSGIREGAADLTLMEVDVQPDSPLVGRTVADYGRNEGQALSFMAIRHQDGQLQIPVTGATIFAPGDLLMVAGDADSIHAMRGHGRSNRVAA